MGIHHKEHKGHKGHKETLWSLCSLWSIPLLLLAAGQPSRLFLDASGKPVPFKTDREIVDFLKSARILSVKEIGEGITGSQKVLLERNGLRVHAIFRFLQEERTIELPSGKRLALRDDRIFECAAYELSLLLGLNNVPPVVEREVNGTPGTLQLWVEKAVTEKERRRRDLLPEDDRVLARQWDTVQIFDNLIYNDDRNNANVLYDQNWKLWMIDHTRSFRPDGELPYPSAIRQCERTLWKKLQQLDSKKLASHLEKFLRTAEIEALIKRHNRLVEHIGDLIAEHGEDRILF